jgi:hypothetical protein
MLRKIAMSVLGLFIAAYFSVAAAFAAVKVEKTVQGLAELLSRQQRRN